MMIRVSSRTALTAFSSEASPVVSVELGEAFELDTFDCYSGQIDSERVLRPHVDMGRFNPATGPVFIHGVEPGDVVRVSILAIDVAQSGVMALSPGLGILGDRITESSTRIVPVIDGLAWITPATPVSVTPMVGVLGVAPLGEPVATSWPGTHGGNLDTRLLTAGSSLLVRANHAGALVAAGDLHAAQGDGELGGTGVEIAGSIRLRVDRADYGGLLPAVQNDAGLSVLASAEDLRQAVRGAFDEAVRLMAEWHDLEWNDAYRLTSIIGQAGISQVVNPLVTARLSIPREWCPDRLWNGG